MPASTPTSSSDLITVTLIGDQGSGRNALFWRYLAETFPPEPQKISGFAYRRSDEVDKFIRVNANTNVALGVYNLHQDAFVKLTYKNYVPKTHACLIAIDMSNANALATLEDRVNEFKKYCVEGAYPPIIVVGTKDDLPKQISDEALLAECERLKLWGPLLTSAKINACVDDVFEFAGRKGYAFAQGIVEEWVPTVQPSVLSPTPTGDIFEKQVVCKEGVLPVAVQWTPPPSPPTPIDEDDVPSIVVSPVKKKSFLRRYGPAMLVGGLLVAGLVIGGIFTFGALPLVLKGVALLGIALSPLYETIIGVSIVGVVSGFIGAGLGAFAKKLYECTCGKSIQMRRARSYAALPVSIQDGVGAGSTGDAARVLGKQALQRRTPENKGPVIVSSTPPPLGYIVSSTPPLGEQGVLTAIPVKVDDAAQEQRVVRKKK